jgi:hypothetical protein
MDVARSRFYAAECLRMAEAARDREMRTLLYDMARAWHAVEDRSDPPSFSAGSTAMSRSPTAAASSQNRQDL